MRIRLETIGEERERRQKWIPWFAWYPVIIDDHFVWLEPVARREVFDGQWSFVSSKEYKFIEIAE